MRNQVIPAGKMIRKMCILAGICSVLAGMKVSAAETVAVRVISTTDIHNQVSSEDYESAALNRTASLAKLSTLIQGARKEMTGGASITVDVGDSVFGYGAEYVMGADLSNRQQPVYQAMSKIGYDAITLGNHDFDYGYDYIKKQLNTSGLGKICLVANVVDMSTGKNAWASTRMVTRTVTTSQGRQATVKIGIVGVTRPSLTSYFDYDGVLETKGIISTVKSNAAALKKAGADIVVAIAHTGMGDQKVTDDSDDVAYALSGLSDVDCVMCGHQHRNYPSDDENAAFFYDLPNVDKTTGLMNGKPVVMVADHARGIGVVDLTLKLSGGKYTVVGAKSEVRKSSPLILPDPVIESVTEAYDAGIEKTFQTKVATLASGSAITGFFGLLEDNYGLQLNNEAKIRYGLQYAGSRAGTAYAGYPVIAATRFYMDGSEGAEDYINISGSITMKDLLNIQRYEHNNNQIYWISGAQLKRWLEWSASIFAQNGEKISSDSLMKKLMEENDAAMVQSDRWSSNWGQYAVFDGIEYEIDASGPARYNHAGKVINKNAVRIKKLTCNGKTVTDSMKLLLVSNIISKSNPVLSEVMDQRLQKRSPEQTVTYLKNYLTEMAGFGDIIPYPDHNWSVKFGGDKPGILRTSALSEPFAEGKKWYQKTLKKTKDYAYYLTDLSEGTGEKDTFGPLLVAAPTITVPTNRQIPIRVQASDSSGVKYCKYLFGNYDAGSAQWSSGKTIKNNSQVSVAQNGTYSFLAVDGNGNRTVKYIRISNINPEILQEPEVNTVSNKKTELTGYAQAGTTIRVAISGNKYSTTVRSNGTFTCNIGKQKAERSVSVYAEDRTGRKSAVVHTKVLRGGPNSPSLDVVTNKTKTISGKLNDTNSTVLVFAGSGLVYVPDRGGTAIYRKCRKYTGKRKVIKTGYRASGGRYRIKIPVQAAKKRITVFAVDIRGRVSLVTSRTVKSAAPNKPQVNTVCDAENYVTGKVPSTKKSCKVTVTIGKKRFSSKSMKTGKFEVKTRELKSGMKLSVRAIDTNKGKKRTSAPASCTVASQKRYMVSSKSKSRISIKKITNRSKQITGKAPAGTYLYLNTGKINIRLEVNRNGKFYYTLPYQLKADKVIYLVNRKKTGEIKEVKRVRVKAVKPSKPVILDKKLTTRLKRMTVLVKEDSRLVVKIGKKKTTVTACKYSKKRKAFIYRVKLPRTKKEQKIVCYVKNSRGKSANVSVKRVKA